MAEKPTKLSEKSVAVPEIAKKLQRQPSAITSRLAKTGLANVVYG